MLEEKMIQLFKLMRRIDGVGNLSSMFTYSGVGFLTVGISKIGVEGYTYYKNMYLNDSDEKALVRIEETYEEVDHILNEYKSQLCLFTA